MLGGFRSMQTVIKIIALGMLLVCGGCSWHRDSETLNALISAAQPFHTPFDSSPELRKSYLGGYRSGYRDGVGGTCVSLYFGPNEPDA